MQHEHKHVFSRAHCLTAETNLERRGACSPWYHSHPPSLPRLCSLISLPVASLCPVLSLPRSYVCAGTMSICPYWHFSPGFSLFSPPPCKIDLLLVCKMQPDSVCLLNGSVCCLQRSGWFSFLNHLADTSSSGILLVVWTINNSSIVHLQSE